MASQTSSLASQFESVNFSTLRLLYGPTLTSIHNYGKNHSFDYMDLCQQSDVFFSFFFLNTRSKFVTAILPRSKCLLIPWLQSPSALILEPKKIKSDAASTFSLSICHEVIGPDAMIGSASLVVPKNRFKNSIHGHNVYFIKFLPCARLWWCNNESNKIHQTIRKSVLMEIMFWWLRIVWKKIITKGEFTRLFHVLDIDNPWVPDIIPHCLSLAD